VGVDPDQFAASRERSRRRREEQRAERARQRRQRLLVGGAAAGGAALIVGLVIALAGGGDDGGASASAAADAKVPELPGGGTTIFPGHRVVAFYGTSGTSDLGTLGRGTPDQAAQRLVRQARAYESDGTKVLPAFEYIATVASNVPGDDGKYRNLRPLAEVRRYLKAARKVGALLIIDVQPGQGDFFEEVQRYAPLLREPDVSLALDPEWKMDPGQIPGQIIGHTDAPTVNRISAWLAGIVRAGHLPQKILLVHEFTEGMIRDQNRVVQRPGLAVTVNVDGFGNRFEKLTKYRDLVPRHTLHPGFKLFYTEDQDIFRPQQVLKRIKPTPLYVDYQ
jgi:hypothetical protein